MKKITRKLDSKIDREILERAYKYEESIFEDAAVGKYNISPFTKYGATYCTYNDEEIISLIEVIYSINGLAYFYGISTNEKYRFKNNASQIIDYALEDLINQGFDKFELTVSIDNENAIKLYKKKGFIIKETLINEYFDGEDKYLMVLDKC